MAIEYLGPLPHTDPLYHFLTEEISSKGNGRSEWPWYNVYRLNGSNEVYLYEDRESGARVVGKFFRDPAKQNGNGWSDSARREFENMCLLRDYGFTESPHYVVRPLGYSSVLNDLLMVEYCDGDSLGSILDDAFRTGQFGRLYDALEALAFFLATLHNRTASPMKADPVKDYYYLSDLLSTLVRNKDLYYDESREITWLGDRWLEAPWLWQDGQVLVHGDATPGNFLIGGGHHVTAIDLERVQYRDRVYDVGRVAGELVHHFLQAYGERSSAEPFIAHFLHHYARHFPDHMAAFHSITKRLPFHMSLTLFRIARNQWLPHQHRSSLIEAGRQIMGAWR